MGSVNYWAEFILADHDALGCEMFLLAKDGVWIPQGTRASTYWKMASGQRVDMAIRCNIAGTTTLDSAAAGGDGGDGGDGDDDDSSDDDNRLLRQRRRMQDQGGIAGGNPFPTGPVASGIIIDGPSRADDA